MLHLDVADAVAVRVAEDRDQVLRVRALAVLLVGQRARCSGTPSSQPGGGVRSPLLRVDARQHHDAVAVPAALVDRGLDAAEAAAGAAAPRCSAAGRSAAPGSAARVWACRRRASARRSGTRGSRPGSGRGRTSRARRARRRLPASRARPAPSRRAARMPTADEVLRPCPDTVNSPSPINGRVPRTPDARPHARPT